MYLRTSALLMEWIKDNITLTESETLESSTIWFVAMQQASVLLDKNRKEVASVLMDGIKPLDSIEAVDEFLETVFHEDEEEFWDEYQDNLIDDLHSHFGE